MSTSAWFDDIPVVGALPPEEAATTLREIGEDEVADGLTEGQENAYDFGGIKQRWWLPRKLWLHTAHAFGYLAPTPNVSAVLPIQPIDMIRADTSLKHSRLKITLERLRVADYPGSGDHRVLVHFFAQNQTTKKTEDVHFNATYRISEGEHAAIRGYPIFVGLAVGSEGLRLKCRTINVKNDQDEAFLDVLESDVFKSGLQLITTAQPAITAFSELALGLAKTIASRHRNISVQDFDLGLDFSDLPMGARLAEGVYLAIQIPESEQPVWNWDAWVYHPAIGQVVSRDNHLQMIPYNYLVFGVNRYEGT